MFQLLQEHTVKIYSLLDKSYRQEVVKARSLLSSQRFDLYAKLFYIRNKNSKPEIAKKIYSDHILAFNPDAKEPGRDDKNGVEDLIQVFDELIEYFRNHEFDDSISLIPVDKNNNPLDGSHRIAALAYFDKEVTIVRFDEVEAKTSFDYQYFIKRGLSLEVADTIALEASRYCSSLFLACLWPRIGNEHQKRFAIEHFRERYEICYEKPMQVSLSALSKLIYETYKHQDWVGNIENGFAGAKSKASSCYAPNGQIYFLLFHANHLQEVIASKEIIRQYYRLDKHALHITDNDLETKEMLELIFTDRKREFQNNTAALIDRITEWIEFSKNVYWLNFKVRLAKIIRKKI